MGASKEFLSRYVRGPMLEDNLVETAEGTPALDMWHGGAPNIEKFDMSYMNSGEGAQMYSPGLYHAGRRGTSKQYRDQYTDKLVQEVNATEGGVIVGDIALTVTPRQWGKVQEALEKKKNRATVYGPVDYKEDVIQSLTQDLQVYAKGLKNDAEGLDYKAHGAQWDEAEDLRRSERADAIRAWREDKGLANAEQQAEAHGELTYEQEMEWMYGPNWKDDPGLMKDIDELNPEPSWGFLREDMSRTEMIYVHVTEMPDGTRKAEWDDSQVGYRTYIYPKGTPDSFIWYSQEFDSYTWRAEREIWAAPPQLHDRHMLAYEVAPDEFKFIDPNEVEPPVNAGGAHDWTHPDDPNFDPDEWWYTGSVQPISTRRMTADGRIIEQNSPEYVEHLEAAIKDIGQTTMDDVDKVAYNIYQGSIPRWDTLAYGPEPDFSALKGGLYKTRLNVNPDKLLDWFEPINRQPEPVQNLIDKYLDVKQLADDGWGSDLWLTDKERARLFGLTGQQFFEEMSRKWGRIQFRDDMAEIGMPGMLYRDWTRNFPNKRPTYNVVMYSDKPIDILERGAANAPMLASVFGITSASLAAAALSQKPDVTASPVLDKDIAEQFPLPAEEQGMFDSLMSNPNVQAALAHPVTQYLGMQIDNSDFPARVPPAVAEGMFNLSQGNSLSDTGDDFLKRLQTPYDETADEVGQYVLKKSNSPALATGAYMGMLGADITNYLGP